MQDVCQAVDTVMSPQEPHLLLAQPGEPVSRGMPFPTPSHCSWACTLVHSCPSLVWALMHHVSWLLGRLCPRTRRAQVPESRRVPWGMWRAWRQHGRSGNPWTPAPVPGLCSW